MESLTEKARCRDEQILSAKKKLKSYRAKQALMAIRKLSTGSVSSDAKSPAVATFALPLANAPSPTHPELKRHGRNPSRTGSIPSPADQIVPQTSSTSQIRPSSVFVASNSHHRSHSRSGSRVVTRSRPSSIMLLGAGKHEPIVLAVEHPASANLVSEAGDTNDQIRQTKQTTAGQSQPFLDSSVLFASPNGKYDPNKENNLESHLPPTSASSNARRLSRHVRKTSVSTKRESMEIMGGLGIGLTSSCSNNSIQAARRRSSRMSALPSASILFGVADSSDGKPRQNWDWRSAFANALEDQQDDQQSRLSALEKLEGKCRPTTTAHSEPNSSSKTPSSASSRNSRRLSGHARQNSIQIPNLDELFTNEVKERQASQTLLDRSNSSDNLVSGSRRESWRSNLAPPLSASLSSNSNPSSPNPTFANAAPPESVIVQNEAALPEGLGTLLEEEEEEESMSPIRERCSFDTPLAGECKTDEQLRQQRRLAEEEIIKRNRRASLTPKPLKLKSRPPNLYLTPSLRNGISPSSSLPVLSPSSPLSPYHDTTPKMLTATLTSEPPSSVGKSLHEAGTKSCPNTLDDSLVEEEDEEREQQAESTVADSLAQSESRPAAKQEMIRAFRTSATSAPLDASAPFSAASPRPPRQGMRALRLGSQTSLASLASTTESPSSSSVGSGSAPGHKRLSLVGSLPPHGSISSLSREDLGIGVPSSSSVRNMRRSSIHYKPSVHSALSESSSLHSSSSSVAAAISTVPLSVHEELKAKVSRDAALLESTKERVERLEQELLIENERSAREYAGLERWSAEEKTQLSARIESVEKAVNESAEAIAALKQELTQANENMQDLEAERDMLQDDVEGWRSRCQDLEKSLRAERLKLEEHRKLKSVAKLRIKQLSHMLEKAQVEVPSDELNVLQALEEPQLDVVSIFRSPALGSASPHLGSGYFSPSMASEAPHQTIKLLAEMRQQIINLAGSLDHERKEHVKSKEEMARLLEEQHRTISSANTSFTNPDSVDESQESNMVKSASGNYDVTGKNQRHVFAYDSSMGSFGQSSASLGSASMSMTTDDMTPDAEEEVSQPPHPFKMLKGESETSIARLGALQTVDEMEEVSESGAEETRSHVATQDDQLWADLEAGGPTDARPSLDASESSFGVPQQYEDASTNVPPTPDLCHGANEYEGETFSSPLSSSPIAVLPGDADATDSERSARSSNSSIESHGAPSTPPCERENETFEDDSFEDLSARPEFIPDWNFETAARRSHLSRSNKSLEADQDQLEDFFGIMCETRLPPLSTSSEPVDMPPVFVHPKDGSILCVANSNLEGRPATRVASVMGKRPPVARSAYMRDSFSDNRASLDIVSEHRDTNSISATSTAASLGSRALSRMSFQGLSNAFSGLSGYLTNQSGAAVTAAAAATKMCSGQANLSRNLNDSMNWTAQRHPLDEDDFGAPVAKQIAAPKAADKMHNGPGSWSSVSTSTSSRTHSADQRKTAAARRFVDPVRIALPTATPIWQLDFSRSTSGGPLFTL